MYKISEFSKITNLTVKALRYYDEEGLLIPSHRDAENQYRYYGEEDFKRAEMIQLLRGLTFSIAEIKEILNTCEDTADLSCYLAEKRNLIEKNMLREKNLLQKLDRLIQPQEGIKAKRVYSIQIKEMQPLTVASIRFQGPYQDVSQYIGKLYSAVKNQGTGPPFNCYYDDSYQEIADIELCVPTKRLVEDKQVTAKELPGIRGISTTHVGSYEQLNWAYKALLDYAAAHRLPCLTPSREFYIKGPGPIFRGNEKKYVTEIIIPFEEIK